MAVVRCRYCGVGFEPTREGVQYCDDHRNDARYRMSAMRRDQVEQTGARTQREAEEIIRAKHAHKANSCLDCGVSLEGKRSNAFYCNNACRMRYQRREHRFGVMILSPRMRRKLRKTIRDTHGPGLTPNLRPTYDRTFKVLSKERFHAICDGKVTSLQTPEISELSRAYPGALLALGIDA